MANAASSASRSGSNAAASVPTLAVAQPPGPSAVQAAAPAPQRPRNARRDSIAAASFAQGISRIVAVVVQHPSTIRPGVQRPEVRPRCQAPCWGGWVGLGPADSRYGADPAPTLPPIERNRYVK